MVSRVTAAVAGAGAYIGTLSSPEVAKKYAQHRKTPVTAPMRNRCKQTHVYGCYRHKPSSSIVVTPCVIGHCNVLFSGRNVCQY